MKNLLKIRMEKNLTQTEIAKSLNVARNTVSQWENSKRDPDCETLIELSKFLNVSIDELLGNELINHQSNSLIIPEDRKSTVELLLKMPDHAFADASGQIRLIAKYSGII